MSTTHSSDAEIKSRVELELRWEPDLDTTHIGLAVTDGSVILSGEVSDYSQIEMAERAAWKVPGVIAVAREIEVRNDIGPINDSDLARAVAAELAGTAEVPSHSVHTTVTHGCVFLTGTVLWDSQRAAAGHAAATVDGARKVVNSIEVSPSAAAEYVSSHIVAALERHARAEGERISVSVDGVGNVVLEGVVRSVEEGEEVEQAAQKARGVSTVSNRLRVAD
ncbi:Osmotically inducible protein Y precursor [Rhodococcus sp. B7740]|uniref:BON domain-containing protein n=1 Tax=Rhodococcus sp. B7740 TaxID=1564114 RepID=UPI0005D932EA|nr:BON domain-containing protein [Rhodococcus sp. B7740]AJW41377.1 Osmotically inducible protein Y precursor [Rhodococcus sp. B7740]